jgi:hypothetical protein
MVPCPPPRAGDRPDCCPTGLDPVASADAIQIVVLENLAAQVGNERVAPQPIAEPQQERAGHRVRPTYRAGSSIESHEVLQPGVDQADERRYVDNGGRLPPTTFCDGFFDFGFELFGASGGRTSTRAGTSVRVSPSDAPAVPALFD